MFIIVMEAFSS